MEMEAVGRDMYLKYVDSAGKVTVVEHRVWDGVKFWDSQVATHQRENITVVVTNRKEYQRWRADLRKPS